MAEYVFLFGLLAVTATSLVCYGWIYLNEQALDSRVEKHGEYLFNNQLYLKGQWLSFEFNIYLYLRVKLKKGFIKHCTPPAEFAVRL